MKWVVVALFVFCFVSSIRGAVLKKSDLLPGKECLPGTRWVSQCNECSCSDEGRPMCTDKLCVGSENEMELHCLPDTIWKNECNTCWCTSTGHAMCTRIGCNVLTVTNFNPTGEEPAAEDKADEEDSSVSDEHNVNYPLHLEDFEDHEVNKRSVCEANERFEIECNSCKCDPHGQSYVCTENECLEMENNDNMDKDVEVFKESEGADHVERHSVCKPRATFHVGCNTCQCNVVGTDFVCATKPCALLNDVELFHEIKALKTPPNKAVVCAANRMFIKDCNTCWCNEDGTSYFCTRKVCVPDLPDEVNPEEVENSSLVRKVRATAQASAKSEHKETPKNCQPGQEFRMDCNKCLCDNEGQNFSCTRIDCNALNNNNNGGVRRKRELTTQLTMDCTPGSVFQQGCKVCRCAEDGRHAICPTHCQHDKQRTENEISNPDSDPSFRCNPGEQFKRSCNDCSCSADGRSFFCTLRFCDEEIKEIAPVL